MGAISMGLPAIYCPAGPMLRGNWRGHTLGSGSDVWKYWDEKRAGNITEADWAEIENGVARSFGTCMTMGTAATMMAIAEALGLTLPGASSLPAADAGHPRMCAQAGRRIVEMVWDDLKPEDILTPAAFENAIAVHMAMGGSTNAIIHVVAMARRAGIALSLDDFDRISRQVPVIANVRPSGAYLMEDFFYAGGLPALMKVLARPSGWPGPDRQRPHDGREHRPGPRCSTPTSSAPLDKAIYGEGGTAVLRGNLAPGGAVMKPSAAEPRLRQHRGRAIVFRDYNHMARRGRPRRSRRHARPRAGAAERRPQGRAGHARVGHAADPAEAGARRRARHAAHLGRAHVGHQLRRLHPARGAGELRRRPAGAGADRRRDRGGRGRSAACTSTSPTRSWPAAAPPGCRPPPRYERGYGRMFQEHIGQADSGCDFDFLEHGPPVPEPEIH